MISEHDRIVLMAPVTRHGLARGDVGTVVHVYADGQAYEVEFVTLDGQTAAVVTLQADQVRPVSPREITHARETGKDVGGLQTSPPSSVLKTASKLDLDPHHP